jgi:hypothetical protein
MSVTPSLARKDPSRDHVLVLTSAEGGKRVIATLDNRLPSSPLALVASEQHRVAASHDTSPRPLSPPVLSSHAPYLHNVYIPAETAQIFTRSLSQHAARRRVSTSPTWEGSKSARLQAARHQAPSAAHASSTNLLPLRRSTAAGSRSAAALPPLPQGAPQPSKSTQSTAGVVPVKRMEPKPAYLKRVLAQVCDCLSYWALCGSLATLLRALQPRAGPDRWLHASARGRTPCRPRQHR